MRIKVIIISLLLTLIFDSNSTSLKPQETTLNKIPQDINTLNEHSLYIALLDSGILHPDIVLAQAILETGYFTSNVTTKYNNLFGLYNSRKGDYFKFNHWRESISAYKRFIEVKYDTKSDYLVFLDKLGYAEDPMYINKVKIIMNKHKNDNNERRSSYQSS